jgi:hypothetical protein
MCGCHLHKAEGMTNHVRRYGVNLHDTDATDNHRFTSCTIIDGTSELQQHVAAFAVA